ncbi:3-hydroxyisobutyrate dehydrogenase protein [Rutstroemia sp. NJR-2017a WRK4]|nr:3-hydroxyisobutyrate dehydrogenase protein [Rutstroemia sp. NJR-2017a WRK4]
MSTLVDVNHHFDGQLHWWKLRRYYNPTLADPEKGPLPPVPTEYHRDALHRETWRPSVLLRYISPTYCKPYHMIVQAAHGPNLLPAREWRRREVGGNAPTLLRVSAWAIGKDDRSVEGIALIVGRSILVLPIIMFIVAYPMGLIGSDAPLYPAFEGRCYEYPKHAINKLDAAPDASNYTKGQKEGIDADKLYTVVGHQDRLLRPRALVVLRNNEWVTTDDGKFTGPYVFISFAAAQYYIKPPSTEINKDELDRRAQKLTIHLGMQAYWCDYRCRAEHQPEVTDDVHRFCDVTRGAKEVCVMLPDTSPEALVFFGARMWCLPEILLARDHKVNLCAPDTKNFDGVDKIERVDIMEFTHRSWARKLNSSREIVRDGNDEIFRLLAEHYSGTLTLSRLELIQVALEALRSRQMTPFQQGDIAYALMTLLTKRPRMDPTDTEEQALARLSLANDSDQIVERMACMDGIRIPKKPGWFNLSDDLGANLWDIDPLCQVAGVCEDGSIILDGAHAISVRWKDIPRIWFTRRQTWKKMAAASSLRSGPTWFLIGIILAATAGENSSTKAGGIILLIIGLILLLTSPYSVKVLYGGKVWGAKPWLIGFEGTLPIADIEYLTFGNSIGRLSYTPSSGPYCTRRPKERIGAEPLVNISDVPPNHRIFTLVDTATLTVTVFSAERPPSVALIAGKEGGMLRAIMCSYERSSNALRKECVLRMETPLWDRSYLHGWVKLT